VVVGEELGTLVVGLRVGAVVGLAVSSGQSSPLTKYANDGKKGQRFGQREIHSLS
jgi:hypothetical protein